MKLLALHHSQQNLAVFDPFSIVHLSVGLGFGLVKIPWPWALGIAVAYEGFEQLAENQPWGKAIFKTSGSETKVNLVSDVVVFMLGWWMGRKYMAQPGEAIGGLRRGSGGFRVNPRRRRKLQ